MLDRTENTAQYWLQKHFLKNTLCFLVRKTILLQPKPKLPSEELSGLPMILSEYEAGNECLSRILKVKNMPYTIHTKPQHRRFVS